MLTTDDCPLCSSLPSFLDVTSELLSHLLPLLCALLLLRAAGCCSLLLPDDACVRGLDRLLVPDTSTIRVVLRI